MSENKTASAKKSISPDWLVRGVLTKIGEAFDRLTGRNWKPSSSLATSEIIEKLKMILDTEAKETNGDGKFVPHNIKLKMQWDKFSTDSEDALKKLEHELLIASIDHINDRRYHTYAPMKMEIMPDYFTEGIKLMASFDDFSEDNHDAAINMSVPDLKNVVIAPVEEIAAEPEKEIYTAEFTVQDKTKKIELAFVERQRLSVGRTKENDLQIDDASVSKIHAALVLNSEKQLMVADTGSTNGTFINNTRIAYGKAIPINDTDKLKFGTVEVVLEYIPDETEEEETIINSEDNSATENLTLINNSEIKENSLAEKDYSTNSEVKTSVKAADEIKNEESPATEPRIKLDFSESEK